jgi:Domain of unknown function (DUF5666)
MPSATSDWKIHVFTRLTHRNPPPPEEADTTDMVQLAISPNPGTAATEVEAVPDSDEYRDDSLEDAFATELDDEESWLAPDARRKVRIRLPAFILGLVIVIGGAFWGGAVVDKHFGVSNTATAAAATGGSATAGRGGATGAEGATGFGGAGGFSAETPAAEGKLSAISGNDLTVTSTSGTKVSVTMTSATVVTRSGQGAAGELTVGDTVVVEGTKASNGKVTATSITATAAGTTNTAAGAGTPTGSGTAGGGFSGDGTAASG